MSAVETPVSESQPTTTPFRPGAAFAGIFAVTFSGLLAVGAVLPVLPRYVNGPLDGSNIAVGVVIGSYAVTACCCDPSPGASPTAAAASPPSSSARSWSRPPASSTCCRSGSSG